MRTYVLWIVMGLGLVLNAQAAQPRSDVKPSQSVNAPNSSPKSGELRALNAQSFEKRKALLIKSYQIKIKILQIEETCVRAAKTKEALKACKKQAHTSRQNLQEQMEQRVKDMRKERKHERREIKKRRKQAAKQQTPQQPSQK